MKVATEFISKIVGRAIMVRDSYSPSTGFSFNKSLGGSFVGAPRINRGMLRVGEKQIIVCGLTYHTLESSRGCTH